MQSNRQIYFYVLKLTVVIAAILAVLSNSLKGQFTMNKKNAVKKAILKCVPDMDVDSKTDQEIQEYFKMNVTPLAVTAGGDVLEDTSALTIINAREGAPVYEGLGEIDLAKEEKLPEDVRVYPVYQYGDGTGKDLYIVSVRGNGLWDKIWGYLALDANMTIQGVFFDHKAETPGLGAEIKDNEEWKGTFKGNKMFKGGELVAVDITKKAIRDSTYQVHSISGATVTSVGVDDMLKNGLTHYLPYFKKLEKEGKVNLK